MTDKKIIPNQSVEKMFAIIEDMSKFGNSRLQDIAKRVGLPASTVLRMIHTLCLCGYAAQDPETYRYYLTLKFVQLGQVISSHNVLQGITHPELVKLSMASGEACSVGIEQNGQVVYVDVVDSPEGVLKITQRIGKIAPLHTTGIGKLLLLNYSAEQIKERYAHNGLTALTPNSINTVEKLLKELEKVKKQGYAMDDEECEAGVRCVAVALHNSLGKVVAGISISGPTQRMAASQISKHKQALAEAAYTIEKKL